MFPLRCFSCNQVFSTEQFIHTQKLANRKDVIKLQKSLENITRLCCRTLLLTSISKIDYRLKYVNMNCDTTTN